MRDDEQCDFSPVGDSDATVHMMAVENYEFWRTQWAKHGLSVYLPWVLLSENLVVKDLSQENVRIGDKFKFDNVILQVTSFREPNHKFAVRMGYAQASGQMIQQGNCGCCLRVLNPVRSCRLVFKHFPTFSGKTVL